MRVAQAQTNQVLTEALLTQIKDYRTGKPVREGGQTSTVPQMLNRSA
jgi:hypothetical protein